MIIAFGRIRGAGNLDKGNSSAVGKMKFYWSWLRRYKEVRKWTQELKSVFICFFLMPYPKVYGWYTRYTFKMENRVFILIWSQPRERKTFHTEDR